MVNLQLKTWFTELDVLVFHKPTKTLVQLLGVENDLVIYKVNEHTKLKGLPLTLPIEDCILLNYTGKFDIEGTKIYEHDVISKDGKLYVVVFDHSCFVALDMEMGYKYPLHKFVVFKRKHCYHQFAEAYEHKIEH